MASKLETVVMPDTLQVSLDRLRTSDGELLGLKDGAYLLVTQSVSSNNPHLHYRSLTLLHDHPRRKGQMIPFGWAGLKLRRDAGRITAETSPINIWILSGTQSVIKYKNMKYSGLTKSLSLFKHPDKFMKPEASFPLFDTGKAGLHVAEENRNQGWGSFLIQARALIAAHEGAVNLEIYIRSYSQKRSRQS